MKLLKLAALLALMLGTVTSSPAQNFHFQGGGGMILDFYSPDLGFINDQLHRFTPGYRDVEGPLTLWGGLGYGEVSRNVRFGGFGFGGGMKESGTFPNPGNPAAPRIRQDVHVDLGGGGIYSEYVLVHPIRRLEGDLNLGIGFGGMSISVFQSDGNLTWDGLWGSLNPDSIHTRTNFDFSMDCGFFMLQPGVSVKYYITHFMALEGHAGYLWIVGMGDWTMNETQILDFPDVDLSAPSFGLRLVFGGGSSRDEE